MSQLLRPRLQRQADHFLVEAVSFAYNESRREIDLLNVPAPSSFGLNSASYHSRDIILIAIEWERKGWGHLRNEGSAYFSFSKAGQEAARQTNKRLLKRSFKKRIADLNWNAVNAVAALIAAVAACIAAYFSYLSLASQ
ncbi:hypothetical protein [Sphingobium sp. AntQ-1]|uniref:hypothetical protein n=1 Tax=Sphingobium sp. AntQ-1 TaxID=2930091 RepID=UPI00234F9003|nr:hypothetical protein [Sphingobium sp. AntQ-1]